MSSSTTTVVTEKGVNTQPKTLQLPRRFATGPYKEIAPTSFEKETEEKGSDDFEAAKVSRHAGLDEALACDDN